MTALPQDAVADLQQRIAELERQLETAVNERDAAIERQTASALVNFRLKNELRAAAERQNASAEILGAIANTHGDAEHALQRIAEATQHFFNAASVTIRIAEGDQWVQTVRVGSSGHLTGAQPTSDLITSGSNLPATVYRENRQIHIPDLDNIDPSMADWPVRTARAAGIRTVCGSPLRHGARASGALIVYRDRLAPFTDDELALQQSFADQAVIAIENARLFNEVQERTHDLSESLQQQTATADVLKVISRSTFDLQTVLDTLVESATHLCEADHAWLFQRDGDFLWFKSSFGHDTEVHNRIRDLFRSRKAHIDRGSIVGRSTLEARVVHVTDVLADPEWNRGDAQKIGGYRAALGVPLLRDGKVVGVIFVAKTRPEPFSANQIELVTTFADQAVIAIENARLFNETQEALERQTATADILKVIASSPSDVQPVFDAIASSSKQLIGGFSATVFRFVDGIVNLVAYTPVSPAADEVLKASFPRPTANLPFFELAKGGRVIQEADAETNPDAGLRDLARARGFRSSLFSPLMSKGTPIGLIVVTRKEPGVFAAHHVQLLETFADQAVIAIENTRLFTETQEALERQTATAEILKVIASSPSDVQPVFEAIVNSAARLFEPCAATITTVKDGKLDWNATATSIPGFNIDSARTIYPIPFDPERAPSARAILERRIIEFPDVESPDTPEFTRRAAAEGGFRSITFVPLIDQEQGIGTIIFTHPQTGYRFSEKQLALIRTFADQAVIAIGNTRLFNEVEARTVELSEALEQQTATAEVLGVISSSAGDLAPVFDAMLGKAMQLCSANFGVLNTYDGKAFHTAATYGLPPAYDEHRRKQPQEYGPATAPARLLEGEPFVQFTDLLESEAYRNGEPNRRALVDIGGARCLLAVPLVKDGHVVGNVMIFRQENRPFSEKQIALLQQFAAQAVIAIENTRLLRELRESTEDLSESLQQQTATAEVLQIISSSPSDLTPLFDKMLENATRVCGAEFGSMVLIEDGDTMRSAALYNAPPALAAARENWTFKIHPQSSIGRAVREKTVIQTEDLRQSATYLEGNASSVELAELGGARTIVVVPMLREDDVIGMITVYRQDVRLFGDKQIDLLRNFARQAVIAIENARLLRELRERTDDLSESLQQQTATSEVLQIISSSPGDLTPVFDKMLENATRVCGGEFGSMNLVEGETARQAALYNAPPAFAAVRANRVFPIHPRSSMAAAIRSKQVVQVEDLRNYPAYLEGNPATVQLAELGGARTLVVVPMLRDDDVIGVITVFRQEVRPFGDKQIELLTNFARQAVIAIENARLLRELRQRTDDLTEALVYQTGSSNILKVIASSPTDVDPALQAIVDSACEICDASDAVVFMKDGDDLVFSAHHGSMPNPTERWPINRNWVTGRAVIDKVPLQAQDLLGSDGEEFPEARKVVPGQGHSTVLSVPLLREGDAIGAISLRRMEALPFSDKQIELLKSFADQAVIAISNVRLFEEVQAKTRDLTESLQFQTATSDVLKVISRSPDALQPVLDAIAETSRELCGSDTATIFILIEGKFHLTAVSGDTILPAHLQHMRSNPVAIGQPGSLLTRVVREKRSLHIPNVMDDPELREGTAGVGGPRALLAAPLMREGEAVGVIILRQSHLKPFTPRQIQAIETFADQAVIAISNVNLFEEVQQRTRELSKSLDDLRTAQDRLIQTEKLASLGQLTAGIAHEIKNPLNFVNNFAALSAELTDELKDVLRPAALDEVIRAEVDEVTGLLKDNLVKVVQHGKRADSIVKNMLLHSREGSGEHRPADVNALVDESLNLAYHGARAEKPQFNVTLKRDFDPQAGQVEVFPQEITRVLLNLISNGFYAVTKRKADNGAADFEPLVTAITRGSGDHVEIRIRDNGTGIPPEVKEKMFNPFYTTKPAGEGTGLGLSMSHDIIVKQHGGTIEVETEPGAFTEFRLTLPRTSLARSNGNR
jgi:GAF domain-containing protein